MEDWRGKVWETTYRYFTTLRGESRETQHPGGLQSPSFPPLIVGEGSLQRDGNLGDGDDPRFF